MKRYALLAIVVLFSAFAMAEGAEGASKVVVMDFIINDSGITQTNASVAYGLPPDCVNMGGDYAYSINSSAGTMRCGLSDPRLSTGDVIAQNGTREGITDVQPEAEFTLVFPFSLGMQSFEIANATTNQSLFTADLSGLARDFCSSHPQDAECAQANPAPDAQGKTLLYIVAAAVVVLLLVLIVLLAIVFLRKKQ